MHEPPQHHHQYRQKRLAALCGAALAAAVFTPVPATADPVGRENAPVPTAVVQQVHTPMAAGALAHSLISTGMIGIGLSMGGLAIVAHRRRQW